MKKQQGITLLEIVIALLILAAGIIALVKFQGDLMRSRVELSQETEALMLAQNQMETLRYYQVLNTTSGFIAYQDIATGSSNVSKTTATYTVAWTITANTAPDYKTAAVTVTWTDPMNTTQTVTLNSIIGKIDPAVSGAGMASLP
jgi:type IV pilus modification protein PilV